MGDLNCPADAGAKGLLPCPFCNVQLTRMSEALGYYHPLGNCTLADFHIEADGYSEQRWNQRPTALREQNAALVELLRRTLAYIPSTLGVTRDIHAALSKEQDT